MIWLTQFEIKYALAGSHLAQSHWVFIMGVSLVAALLVSALGFAALREYRVAHASPIDQAAGITHRTRFMCQISLMTCGLFLLVIIAQGIADIFHLRGPS